ncbi:unnamed protein product [Rhodiola kirilowii]
MNLTEWKGDLFAAIVLSFGEFCNAQYVKTYNILMVQLQVPYANHNKQVLRLHSQSGLSNGATGRKF